MHVNHGTNDRSIEKLNRRRSIRPGFVKYRDFQDVSRRLRVAKNSEDDNVSEFQSSYF